ncbi:MAG: hypothetical protein KDI17_18965, partial [Halioglobus sp.]|nr:hypothetical protein [Halioglobus sp.]
GESAAYGNHSHIQIGGRCHPAIWTSSVLAYAQSELTERWWLIGAALLMWTYQTAPLQSLARRLRRLSWSIGKGIQSAQGDYFGPGFGQTPSVWQ